MPRKDARPLVVCPCGKTIPRVEGTKTRYTYRKYCDAECRRLYAAKRQKDPAKYVTFNCETCGKENTRYKGYGNGANRFCDNTCAQKHTRKKVHIVVEDAVVLDSKWEALFWGLMGFCKIPCERYDRTHAVMWAPDQWYAPDFWLPGIGMAVEVKGLEDEHDAERWAAYRERFGPLLVIGRDKMDKMRKRPVDQIGQWMEHNARLQVVA